VKPASRARRIAHEEAGWSLLELLVTLVIIGVLLAIAVPGYLGYQRKATQTTAVSNLRAALPAVEAFHQDNGTYDAGTMTIGALRAYDQGIAPGVAVLSGSAGTYCLRSTLGATSVYQSGPGAAVVTTPCT
jgi:type IV pilus assembly protein PilA